MINITVTAIELNIYYLSPLLDFGHAFSFAWEDPLKIKLLNACKPSLDSRPHALSMPLLTNKGLSTWVSRLMWQPPSPGGCLPILNGGGPD